MEVSTEMLNQIRARHDDNNVVKFMKLSEEAIPFKYSREDDACMDMYCSTDEILTINETTIIFTRIAIKIPSGFEGRIIGRSGLSSKGILVHHGVIDEQYRGEIGIMITNLSGNDFFINAGDRIAQFSIHQVNRINLKEVKELSITNRASNGFGSSGK